MQGLRHVGFVHHGRHEAHEVPRGVHVAGQAAPGGHGGRGGEEAVQDPLGHGGVRPHGGGRLPEPGLPGTLRLQAHGVGAQPGQVGGAHGREHALGAGLAREAERPPGPEGR